MFGARGMVAGCAVLALLAGCGSVGVPQLESGEPASFLTKPIGLISDTQFHESRGRPSRTLGKAGDEFVPVTVRTAQQVIGTGDMLLAALNRIGKDKLVLHVGDALDVSCESEWALFTTVMKEGRGKPGPDSWLFTPGNHDGYLVGNLLTRDGGNYLNGFWHDMCSPGRARPLGTPVVNNRSFTKNKVVQAYLGQLHDATGLPTDQDEGCNANRTYCWNRHLAAEDMQWQTTLVQAVKLPSDGAAAPIYAVMLDSSDYAVEALSPLEWSGTHGDFSELQLNAVNALLARLPDGSRYFFAAHHPMKAWGMPSWDQARRTIWDGFLKDPRFLRFLVTAHTHEGGWYRHRAVHGDLLELNLGSLNDWPVYYRTLEFFQDGKGRTGVRSNPKYLDPDAQGCAADVVPQPEKETGYSTAEQSPASYTSTEEGTRRWLAIAVNATREFLDQSEAKHQELNPQLLAYAKIVEDTMEENRPFAYEPFGVGHGNGSGGPAPVYKDKHELAETMRYQAYCVERSGLCSLQAKANMLLAVERYYWDGSTPRKNREDAGKLRLCAALQGSKQTAELANQMGDVAKIQKRAEPVDVLLPVRW